MIDMAPIEKTISAAQSSPVRSSHSMSESLGLWEPKRTLTLEAARQHSQNIFWLRRALMGLSLCLSLYVLWNFSQRQNSVIIADVNPTESARMVNPRYNGRTADGLPYKLTAATATRNHQNSNIVNLSDPVLEFFRTEGVQSSFVSATRGVYDDVAQILELNQNVELITDDGNHCQTSHALVFTQENRIEGNAPIKCSGNFGVIGGNQYNITDNYSRFNFTHGMTGQIEKNETALLRNGATELSSEPADNGGAP